MLRIMYKHRNYGGWECIGSYDDLREATKDLNRYKIGILGETGTLKLVNESEYKWLDDEEEDM